MRRVLVTGATGFIGRCCLDSLVSCAREVHAVSSHPVSSGEPGVQWHQADLLDAPQSDSLMRAVRPTHLLHFAWYTEHGKYWTSLENLRWVEASLRLIGQFAREGGSRAVVAGSCAEYDWSTHAVCGERATPLAPRTLYGASKKALWELLDRLSVEAGLSYAWGRVFFAYGPREAPQRLVSSVVRSLLEGEPARCSHAEQIRDLLFVQDVAEAFVALLKSPVTGPVNIASGLPVALKEVILAIARKLGREDLVRLGALPAAEGDPRVLVASVDRLMREVDWRPAHDLDSGLEETIGWWRKRLQPARG